MSYAYLIRTKEAKLAITAYLKRFWGNICRAVVNRRVTPYVRQQERDLLVNGFRKVGLPICASETYLVKVAKPVRLPECVKT
jgi:hypothetical protein